MAIMMATGLGFYYDLKYGVTRASERLVDVTAEVKAIRTEMNGMKEAIAVQDLALKMFEIKVNYALMGVKTNKFE